MARFSNNGVAYCGNCSAPALTCGGRCAQVKETKKVDDNPATHNMSAKELKKLGLWN
jgi:hypothetical protein